MRILLVPAVGGVGLGPLTNVLAVAESAIAAKHEVAFLCRSSWLPIINAKGYEAYLAPAPPQHYGPTPPPYKLSDVVIGLGWVEKSYIRASIEAELKAIRLFSADLVVSMLQLTAPISAAISSRPSAAIFSWADGPMFRSPLYQEHETSSGWEEVYNEIFHEYGIQPITDICDLAYLRSEIKIVPSIPELQPEFLLEPEINFVGPLLSTALENGSLPHEFATQCKNGPLIFVYLSPGDIKPDIWLPTLIKTFEGTNYNVAVTLAPLAISPQSLPCCQNIHFYERLPGTTAINHSDLVITHGGANTVLNAIGCGVPQIIFPDKYAERDYNGRAVARLGAGVNLSTDDFTPTSLLDNVERVLSDAQFKENAVRLSKVIKNYTGSKRVIEVLEGKL